MKWEYLAIKLHSVDANGVVLDDKKLTQELNRLGVQGWELTTELTPMNVDFRTFIFKRAMKQ